MNTWLKVFALALLIITVQIQANDHEKKNHQIIQDYIQLTYGDSLPLSSIEIDQLSWVMDNPHSTPEQTATATSSDIHRDIPRALARIYNLKLLQKGNDEAYRLFIAPQNSLDCQPLSRAAFQNLSRLFQALSLSEIEVLRAAAIISAVPLSPKAKEKASETFSQPLPQDSTQFLSLTATRAASVYPLAKHIIEKHPSAARLFTIVFFPDSHLRHMMYNEGSLNMYQPLRQALAEKKLNQDDLKLWYAYWVDNIAGFRGHISPVGSVYLSENTYRAMDAVWQQLMKMADQPKFNPMVGYLKIRSQWLGLDRMIGVSSGEKLALAALAATLRLFTPAEGQELVTAFRSLHPKQQSAWEHYQWRQRQLTGTPSPTYVPALFGNALSLTDLQTTIRKLLPFYLKVVQRAEFLRKEGALASSTPVSFFKISQSGTISRLLSASGNPAFLIEPETGLVKLKPVQ
ncbi:hypothetical protein EOPP23_04600 [Endozoicomonas sp. OPT23]|uniref:hypothetical protein n=1 Tax=Endozoicomonas sp. OPT23 TaxID=2072845 RepID=UPI00129BA7BB|nr:hypothetical protein [Endozoicomonas sp. OPT23]MRI32273.1 hypothetical protein [Endozoicomonas sp. OPT23]